ncbi:retrovirus-related pol polyprotein from transposon TNT 1-94 [Tanacetum coccineum]
MRTRRSNYPNNSNVTIPRRHRRQVSNIVEPEIRTIVTPMAERTMEELLRAPTEGSVLTDPETYNTASATLRSNIMIKKSVSMRNFPLSLSRIGQPSFLSLYCDIQYTTIVHTTAPNSKHVTKWTKDHPLDNIISELERHVSTRLQLHKQALFCYYDAFLTSVEPKNYKDALTQACWIKAVQEELNEFEHLEVWELVPRPDKVMVITLKWIYKVELDTLGGILKKKAHLVARGYHQEEGIDFGESFALVARLDAI